MIQYSEKYIETNMIQLEELYKGNGKIDIYESQIYINGYYIDAIGKDAKGNLYIIEIKKGEVNGKALAQVLNYMYYAEKYWKKSKYYKNIYGVLVGESLSCYMQDAIKMIDKVNFIKYKIEIEYESKIYQDLEENNNEDRFNELVDMYDIGYDEYVNNIQEVEEYLNGKKKNDK